MRGNSNGNSFIQKIAMLWFIGCVLYGIWWVVDVKVDVSLSKEARQALAPMGPVKRMFANLGGD